MFYLAIGTSTGAATSGLDTKEVIQKSTDEVVMEKQPTGRVPDQEWENR